MCFADAVVERFWKLADSDAEMASLRDMDGKGHGWRDMDGRDMDGGPKGQPFQIGMDGLVSYGGTTTEGRSVRTIWSDIDV